MLFNEKGILNLDEMIAEVPSFQTIMSDGIVTDDELQGQSDRVIALLEEAERQMSPADLELMKKIFAEVNVLSAIYHFYELQNLR